MFELIRKRTLILVHGEFFQLNLVEEVISSNGKNMGQLEYEMKDSKGRSKENILEREEGNSSNDYIDEDDDSSEWSESKLKDDEGDAETSWDFVPETPLENETNEMEEEATLENERNERVREEPLGLSYNDELIDANAKENQTMEKDKVKESDEMEANEGLRFGQVVPKRLTNKVRKVEKKKKNGSGNISGKKEAPTEEKEDSSEEEQVEKSDPFSLGPIIETVMGNNQRKTKFRKIIQNHAISQKTRFENWRDFIQGLSSSGKESKGVRRGKIKKKRGRKSKKGVNQIDGGIVISDSQVRSCNMQVEKQSCEVEARKMVEKGVQMGFINPQDNEKVWKIFTEWEKRDQEGE